MPTKSRTKNASTNPSLKKRSTNNPQKSFPKSIFVTKEICNLTNNTSMTKNGPNSSLVLAQATVAPIDIYGNYSPNCRQAQAPLQSTKLLQSVLASKDPAGAVFNPLRKKKKVSFAPDTINYCREEKPYKYHEMCRSNARVQSGYYYPTLRFNNKSSSSALIQDSWRNFNNYSYDMNGKGCNYKWNDFSSTYLANSTEPQAQLQSSTQVRSFIQQKGLTYDPKSFTEVVTKLKPEGTSSLFPTTTNSYVHSSTSSKPEGFAFKIPANIKNQSSIKLQSDSDEDKGTMSLQAGAGKDNNDNNGNGDRIQAAEMNEEGRTQQFENEYVKFTQVRKPYDYLSKRSSRPSSTRAQRLHQLIKELKAAHITYNSITNTSLRDRFLMDQIIIRYILAFDLALTENYNGFALEIANAMADTTKHMLPLYSHLFYNSDGSRKELPLIVTEEGEQAEEEVTKGLGQISNAKSNGNARNDEFIHTIGQIVSCLNKISENRPRNDNNFLNLETMFTKLQLEMITLMICPIRSAMFRAILEVVTCTASTACTLLMDKATKLNTDPTNPITVSAAVLIERSSSDQDGRKFENRRKQVDSTIRWVNNSALYKDYVNILRSVGLADTIGCLSHIPNITKDFSTTPASSEYSIGTQNDSKTSRTNNKPVPSPIKPSTPTTRRKDKKATGKIHSTSDSAEESYDRVNYVVRPLSPMNMFNTNLT